MVRKRDGQHTVEARVFRGDGLAVWVEAFSLDNPRGERRELVSRTWGNESQAVRLQGAGIGAQRRPAQSMITEECAQNVPVRSAFLITP